MTWVWIAIGGAMLLGIYLGLIIAGVIAAVATIPPWPEVDDDETDLAGVGDRRGDRHLGRKSADGHPWGLSV